jgi:hypothetical protein
MQLLSAEVGWNARRWLVGALVGVVALGAAVATRGLGHVPRAHHGIHTSGACPDLTRAWQPTPRAAPALPAHAPAVPACVELVIAPNTVRHLCGPLQTIRLDGAGRFQIDVVPRHDPDGVMAPFRPAPRHRR